MTCDEYDAISPHDLLRVAAPHWRPSMNATKPLRLQPAKLLRSKWTAVLPQHREKHFIVTALIDPDTPGAPIEVVTIEAVLTGRSVNLPWRELADASIWQQGWR